MTSMTWVKDKLGLGSQLFTGGHPRFSRNDSSNSNSSTNSAPVTATNTPVSTPLRVPTPKPRNQGPQSPKPHQPSLAYSNRQNSFPGPPKKPSPSEGTTNNRQFSNWKLLSAKSSSFAMINGERSTSPSANNHSVSGGNTPSGSLRRRRFKQQYLSRMESRRLSRQTSSGTSLSTSQEYFSSGSSISANPIVDRILEYIRENHANQLEPFAFGIGQKIRLTPFASFRLESGELHGASNFERIGDSKLIKSSEEFAQIILASNIMLSDLLVEILFHAKFVRFMFRDKYLRIFIEKCIFYLELAIDHTMSAKIKVLRLVSIDGVECKTRGIPFPLNKSFDSFALKTIHTMAANSEQYTEQIVLIVNQFCDNLIENAVKSLSLMDLFW